jgi:hypothetical protein
MGSHEYNEPDKIGSHITSGPRLVRFAGIIMDELTDGENIFERVGVWRIDHELAGHTCSRLAGGRCDAGLRCSIAWRLCQILGAQSYKGDGGSNMLVYGQHRSDIILHLK